MLSSTNPKLFNNLPDRPQDDEFHKVYTKHHLLLETGSQQRISQQAPKIYWPASQFKMHNSGLFTSLNEDIQTEILEKCSAHILNESYFIEKAGIGFATKMILHSEYTEDSQFYSLMAADEAVHLEILKKYILPNSQFYLQNPLLKLLKQIIEDSEPSQLLYLIQIILEGWGLNHYLQLSKNCLNLSLKEALQKIIKDEAIHSSAGKHLFQTQILSKKQKTELKEKLISLASMTRVGEVSLLGIFNQTTGGLTKASQLTFLEEIDNLQTTQNKLNLLLKLASEESLEEIVQEVYDQGYFTACSNQECLSFIK